MEVISMSEFNETLDQDDTEFYYVSDLDSIDGSEPVSLADYDNRLPRVLEK